MCVFLLKWYVGHDRLVLTHVVNSNLCIVIANLYSTTFRETDQRCSEPDNLKP